MVHPGLIWVMTTFVRFWAGGGDGNGGDRSSLMLIRAHTITVDIQPKTDQQEVADQWQGHDQTNILDAEPG